MAGWPYKRSLREVAGAHHRITGDRRAVVLAHPSLEARSGGKFIRQQAVELFEDTCIAIIKRKPPQVVKRLNAYKVGDIGISWVTLATNNTREFSRIKGLTVVDWLASSD